MTGSTIRTRTAALARTAFAALALFGAAAQAQAPLVVGASVAQTGAHADLGAEYARGLELWRDQVNAAGGLLGRPVELRILDDGSDASRVRALYARLVQEKADALIGPYGTAATLVAAAEAEAAQRVLINGAGWSRAVHNRSPRYVFQSAVPYAAYGAPVLELARDAGLKKAVILARDDPASTEMGAAASAEAKRLGVLAGEVQAFSGGIQDFVPLVRRLAAASPEAWIVYGEARDAAEIVKAFRKLNYAPKLLFVRGAADARLLDMLGQDAEYAMGAAPFHPRAAGAEAFVRAYEARWNRRPGVAAAEGYAAGTVLAEGVRRAGTSEPRALRGALGALQTATVLGPFKVDPATGEQVAAQPAVVQVVLGRYEVVAPPVRATAKAVLPYPAWEDRRLLK
ncbi:MAG TPA: amino acid ABC transporter substrate-binding protein [Burkholderiales bacterium]|nr:amino acid ABC transporter substrate-binding protein [Burkholderiales bacterium]